MHLQDGPGFPLTSIPAAQLRFHQVVTSRQLGQLAALLGGWSGARVAEDQAGSQLVDDPHPNGKMVHVTWEYENNWLVVTGT